MQFLKEFAEYPRWLRFSKPPVRKCSRSHRLENALEATGVKRFQDISPCQSQGSTLHAVLQLHCSTPSLRS